MEIITAPNELLLKPSEVVQQGDDLSFIAEMKTILASTASCGLSAIQVGIPLRVIVLNEGFELITGGTTVLINPELVQVGEELASLEEGCLSLPDVFLTVERPTSVVIKYQTENWEDATLNANNHILAAVLQHELDHLNGKTILDRSSKIRTLMTKVMSVFGK